MIFYFSGTGNSKYVAKKAQDNEELIDITQSLKENNFNYKVKNGEKIGFIFPVYYWGLPSVVSEFVNKLQLEHDDDPFIYTVITCHSFVGNADKNLEEILKSKNLKLNSSYSVKMPENYIMVFDIDNEEEINLFLDESEKEIRKVVSNIKSNKEGYFAYRSNLAPFTFIANRIYNIVRNTKKFEVSENCNNCGLCENICPSNAIKIKNGKPVWIKNKCSHCSGCINRCPKKAIDYGNKTKKRRRYLNPNVKLNKKY
ncbi:EFR1 family ferrodoxin [Methanobrevibacter sp. OttesenSCG-928-K11]|nr:EFR1 family ferrodoxin [Methanobrevibacter sp. OttesenSCG-928-K11]MDL2270538.1 EFR1 family ferrodoxin [Methanobrevibacter sp. OttesenSCG-928-I08]